MKVTYFEFSEMMVDSEGLNILSRSASINVLELAKNKKYGRSINAFQDQSKISFNHMNLTNTVSR